MHLVFNQQLHPFRSPGLFTFLCLLQEAHPNWVDLNSIKARLPAIDPRQLARFIDFLEAAELALVHYETKTRGRYQLAVEPSEISFSGLPTSASVTGSRSQLPPPAEPLELYQQGAWVVWVVALFHSRLELHGGNLSGAEGALWHLDQAEAAANALPPWARSVVHACRAHVLVKTSRFREAGFWLRRVDTAARQGNAHPATQAWAHTIKLKIRYNQGRYDDVERLLKFPPGGSVALPEMLNLQALLSGRKSLHATSGEAKPLLAKTCAALTQAMGSVFLWCSDLSLLDALCYNLGNNLARAINQGVLPESCADTAMQWLAVNMLVCEKLRAGEDSVLANLLLIDVGLEHGYSVANWPPPLQQGLNLPDDFEEFLRRTLEQARRIGNRLEIAQCLRRLMRLTASKETAINAYFEATELFQEIGQKKVVGQLNSEWTSRFSEPPPSLSINGWRCLGRSK